MSLKSEYVACCGKAKTMLVANGDEVRLLITGPETGEVPVCHVELRIAYCPFCGKCLDVSRQAELTAHDIEVITLKHDRDLLFDVCHSLEVKNTALEEELGSLRSRANELEPISGETW